MRAIRRPGFLGNTDYWFTTSADVPDTQTQIALTETQARRGHTSSGSARSRFYYTVPRSTEKRLFDWLPGFLHNNNEE